MGWGKGCGSGEGKLCFVQGCDVTVNFSHHLPPSSTNCYVRCQYELLLPKLCSWQRRFCVKAWGWKRQGDLEEDRAMQYCWYCVSFCWILSSFFICLTSAVALLVGEKLQEEATLVVSAGQFHHLGAQMWWCENTDCVSPSWGRTGVTAQFLNVSCGFIQILKTSIKLEGSFRVFCYFLFYRMTHLR